MMYFIFVINKNTEKGDRAHQTQQVKNKTKHKNTSKESTLLAFPSCFLLQ